MNALLSLQKAFADRMFVNIRCRFGENPDWALLEKLRVESDILPRVSIDLASKFWEWPKTISRFRKVWQDAYTAWMMTEEEDPKCGMDLYPPSAQARGDVYAAFKVAEFLKGD